jgi:hypothetical protein
MFRNKKKEKEIERMEKFKESETDIRAKCRTMPCAYLYVEKQRNDDGEEPTYELWYHKEAKQFFGAYRADAMCFLDETLPDAAPAPTEVQENIEEDVPF